MDKFKTFAEVEGIKLSETFLASSEEEALEMYENHLKWLYPVKEIKMGEVIKKSSPEKIRMRGKSED